MVDDARVPVSTGEFLELRRSIGDDTTVLEKFDDQLRGMAETDPDRAADIFVALSRSAIKDDRDVAAIYVRFLLPARQEQAKNVISRLLNDPDDDIRLQAHDSLDEAVDSGLITATEAARLIAAQASS
jgi:hypothetical protein